MIATHSHTGKGKVSYYIEDKIAYLLFFVFTLAGFVAGFFLGGII